MSEHNSSAEAREAQRLIEQLDKAQPIIMGMGMFAALHGMTASNGESVDVPQLFAEIKSALRAPVRAWEPIETFAGGLLDNVLIATVEGVVGEAWRNRDEWWWDVDRKVSAPVTHWQPLPLPPVASPQTEQAR